MKKLLRSALAALLLLMCACTPAAPGSDEVGREANVETGKTDAITSAVTEFLSSSLRYVYIAQDETADLTVSEIPDAYSDFRAAQLSAAGEGSFLLFSENSFSEESCLQYYKNYKEYYSYYYSTIEITISDFDVQVEINNVLSNEEFAVVDATVMLKYRYSTSNSTSGEKLRYNVGLAFEDGNWKITEVITDDESYRNCCSPDFDIGKATGSAP